jgi:hypothetical protein
LPNDVTLEIEIPNCPYLILIFKNQTVSSPDEYGIPFFNMIVFDVPHPIESTFEPNLYGIG